MSGSSSLLPVCRRGRRGDSCCRLPYCDQHDSLNLHGNHHGEGWTDFQFNFTQVFLPGATFKILPTTSHNPLATNTRSHFLRLASAGHWNVREKSRVRQMLPRCLDVWHNQAPKRLEVSVSSQLFRRLANTTLIVNNISTSIDTFTKYLVSTYYREH